MNTVEGEGPPLSFGVDSMVLIYHFEENAEFGQAAAELLRAAEEGRCRLVMSVLGRLEVLVAPKRHGRDDLCRRYRDLFDGFPNLFVAAVDDRIVERASDLRAVHDLRTPDAIHLATALEHGADAFVTEDRRHFPESLGSLSILTLDAAVGRLPR